jgi:DNA-binding NtrC family response regulator
MNASFRVLIVDDRISVRQTVRGILDGYRCRFVEADSGVAALRHIARSRFDVIFLDLQLPDQSGLDVLRTARDIRPELGRIIVMTGLPDPATEAHARALGVVEYLIKSPLSRTGVRAAFERAVEALLPQPTAARREPDDRSARESTTVSKPHRTNSDQSRAKLLVLDDSRAWLDAIANVLGEEFDLTLTTSPDQAAKYASQGRFALVVLDMQLLGGLSGLDVLSRMRRKSPDLRAVILAENPDYESAVESGRRGALDFVSKGQLSRLAATVRRFLGVAREPLRVFLSYARDDKPKVLRVYDKLTARGFLPWMDVKNINPGQAWEPAIFRAITDADLFVFFLSHHSVFREGMLRKELLFALEKQRGLLDDHVFILTARLDDTQPAPPLDKYQYIDYRRGGLLRQLDTLERSKALRR